MEMLKAALRRLAKAVVVITSADSEGTRYAMAATAVSELSLEPPSMLVSVNRAASVYPILATRAPFVINILHCSQVEMAQNCSGAVKGEDRFKIGDWRPTSLGAPRLVDAQASIVCKNAFSIGYGTHGIFIGDVEEVFIHGEPDPLIYLDGQYTRMLGAVGDTPGTA